VVDAGTTVRSKQHYCLVFIFVISIASVVFVVFGIFAVLMTFLVFSYIAFVVFVVSRIFVIFIARCRRYFVVRSVHSPQLNVTVVYQCCCRFSPCCRICMARCPEWRHSESLSMNERRR
jgi:hypothetical protein